MLNGLKRRSEGDRALGLLLLGVLFAGVLLHIVVHRGLYFGSGVRSFACTDPQVVEADLDCFALQLQSAEMIRVILDGDRKALRLIDVWPSGPEYMILAAQEYGIDALLLPCISRAEGPTQKMIDHRNPYGLESGGQLLRFKSFEEATARAARLLALLTAGDRVDIPELAKRWCPKNESLWCANVSAIYSGALIKYKSLSKVGNRDAVTGD